jgi:hypothetical protein
MFSVQSFVRHVPPNLLSNYLVRSNISIELPGDHEPALARARAFAEAHSALSEAEQERCDHDISRISALADEAGQSAIYSVSRHAAQLDAQENAHARALWLFMYEPEEFRHAEEVRYTDDRRRGRMWDGFVGDPDLDVRRDPISLASFEGNLSQLFGSQHIHVDIFDREKPRYSGSPRRLTQVTIYREGRSSDVLTFVEGVLDRKVHRPVFEAAVIYERESGVFEVVAQDRDVREELVKLVSRDLLDSDFGADRLLLRSYDLKVLTRPFEFPSDPEDRIESVRVNMLRLMPLDTQAERVVLESKRQANGTIWGMAETRFGSNNPLLSGWTVTQARLTIRFHPENGRGRAKTLPLTITMPHGCDLKDRTERERIIGEKYLDRWQIARDV